MDNELNETTARTVNAELWEALPGMMKRRCSQCRYFFPMRRPRRRRALPCHCAG